MAQGVQVHGVAVRHGEKQEKEECEVEQEVESDGEKTLKDEDTCAWMGWSEKTNEIGCEHVRRCNYRRRAVCSMLHGQLVCVRRVVHTIVHIALNVGENVLGVVHIVP